MDIHSEPDADESSPADDAEVLVVAAAHSTQPCVMCMTMIGHRSSCPPVSFKR
jgi:hypothetical protein